MNMNEQISAPAVAIIGMAGRFPGATSVAELWTNLLAGIESITRFAQDQVRNPGDAEQVNARGVLAGADLFDAGFFGITPREAELMDPQHRLLLECAWEALEDAGCDPRQYTGAIGVYAGQSFPTYLLANLSSDRSFLERLTCDYQVGSYPTVLGNDKDYLTTRISYKLGLSGPSMTLQTACSTSLVAVTQAVQSLLSYQCDVALAGGVSITFPQERGYHFMEGGMVSGDGHCRAFDADAQGTVFGSGVALVTLKRLEDALADGDRIVAVIRSAALNNDGAQKVGYMAPSVERQAEVIALAHSLAGITADSIGYVEAHGTATPLGDPIEVEALTRAFRATTEATNYCAIGSVKTNLGHLEVASGVTGLIKAALAVQHGVIPASLHFRRPNPKIDFTKTPFRVNATRSPWPAISGPRRAGVSSFGVGGTNAHVIIEQPPTTAPVASNTPQVLVLSARTPAALAAMRERLAKHLDSVPTIPLADVAWTLQTGRRTFAHRAMVVARDAAGASARLRDGTTVPTAECAADDTPVAFLFPGQGAQRAGMTAGLYRDEPRFRAALDECLAAVANECPDLRAVLFDPARASDLIQTRYTQPALFATSYALAQVWLARGVTPAAMIGHSVGEYVAACLAGVMPLATAMRAVAVRGKLVQALPGGAMLAVRLGEAELLPLIAGKPLSLAASNGPASCVIAGGAEAIAAFESDLVGRGIAARHLTTSHAFHSAMMDGMLPAFAEHLRDVQFSAPTIPFISGVTGTWITTAQATDPQYWVRHVREAVRFAAGVATITADQRLALLEVGPGRTLAGLARQCLPTSDRRSVVATLPTTGETESPGDAAELADAAGRLWLAGVPLAWAKFHPARPARTPLPTYPFERSRYWVEPPPIDAATTTADLTANQATTAAATVTAAPATSGDRHTALIELLRQLVSEQSGADHRATDTAISFIELGFDSLFLTQFALALQQRFKIKISFRHLLDELGTVARLAEYVEHHAAPALLPTVGVSAADAPAATTGNPMLDQMQRQLAELSKQMAQLSGGTAGMAAAPSAAEASAAQPAAPGEFKAFGPYKPITRGPTGGLTEHQQRWLDAFIVRYTAKTKESKRQAQHHREYLADPRVVAGFRQQWKEMVYPLVAVRSKGARLWDVDGNEYIDILNGFGSSLFGHSPDFVNDAVTKQLSAGIEVGPQTPLAGEVAKLVSEFTGLERATFCNTGSEAVMAAMRLARTVTGRSTIVSFLGDYHGTFDEVLVRPNHRGNDLRSAPIAPGIPQGKVDNIIILEYGSQQALEIIRARADDLAAVLIEPVQSRHPDLQPKEFLHEVRRITAASGTAMIMDEVITGFRVHPRGAQGVFGVKADLATYGKVIGGGHPIGILAGTNRFMDALDGGQWRFGDDSFPEIGVTFFAGTFVRHPLAMAAAKACLVHLKEQGPALQEALNRRTTRLVDALNGLFKKYGVPSFVQRFGSVFYFAFAPKHRMLSLLHYLLRLRGIHIWEGFPCFLTTAHGDAEIDLFIRAVEGSLQELTDGGFLPASGTTPDPAQEKTSPESVPAVVAIVAAQPSPSDDTSSIVMPLAEQLPLTEVQRELWVASQLSPEASVAFNDGVLLHLDGPLDHARLRLALQQVVDRHPALRSRFDADGECQRFVAQVAVDLPLVDLASGDNQQRLEQHRAALTATPFDLTCAPLLRASLVRLGSERHVLILITHHLVCDGWSFAVVINELGQCYSALVTGLPLNLPAAVPYHAYAAWQSARRDGPEGRVSLDHWRSLFRESPPDLDLPLDHPRRPSRTFAGATERLLVDATAYRRMQQVCGRSGATVFAGMLAAFTALMSRLSHQDDLVIGIPSAGQLLMGVDRLAGHCVHFLPLRLSMTANTPFATALRSVRDAVLDAQEHPDITYGRLLESLTLPRDPARPPLLSALFNFDRAGFKDLGLSGLRSTVELNAKAGVVFDIDFNLMETDQGLTLCCHYNRDLFEPSTIRRWLGHFLTLADDAARDPTRMIGDLELLSAPERTQILETWNATAREYPKDRAVHDLIAQQAAATPEAIAVVAGEERLTYRALDQLSTRLAAQLVARGASRTAPVAICLPRTTALPIAVLAVLKAGACYVPLDSRYPDHRITQILEDARPALVITQTTEWAPFSRHETTTVLMDSGWEQRLPDGEAPRVTVVPEDLAYLLFTSGSTGRPKGVQVPHRAVVNLLSSMRERPGITARDTLLAITTLSFDIHVAELLLPLSVGARIVLAEREAAADPRRLIELLDSSRATIFQATPVTMRMLLEAGWKGDGRIRLWCGGEAIPRDLADALLARAGELWNGYGPTETTVYSSLDRVERGTSAVLMGTPVANTRLHLLDQRLRPVPIGVPGELYIGGDGLAHGYVGLPEQTTARFIPDPFAQGGSRQLYRTGDIGRYHTDGRIEYLGRSDHQVKIRGFRIELGDIEVALASHPAISQRVVVALRTAGQADANLIAYVALHRGTEASAADLRRHLRGLLPIYMVPSAIIILGELPLTPNGKIDRKALPAPVPAQTTQATPTVPPRAGTEEQIAEQWRALFPGVAINTTDDFFALGGHSLLAMKLALRLEASFGRKVPLTTIFAHPTIAELAQELAGGNPEKLPSDTLLQPLQTVGTRTPFFFIGGFLDIARHVGPDQPFYGLDCPEHTKGDETFASIAKRCITAMKRIQPRGPYLLGGHCYGAVVAFSIAVRLQQAGEEVALLALMEPPDPPQCAIKPRWRDRVWFHLRQLTKQGPLGLVSYSWARLRNMSNHMAGSLLNGGDDDLYRDFEPSHFQGQVTLLLAKDSYLAVTPERDPRLMWRQWSTDGVVIHESPGDHVTFCREPGVRILGGLLRRCLDQGTTKPSQDPSLTLAKATP